MNLSTPTRQRLFSRHFIGPKVYVAQVLNVPIIITDYEVVNSRQNLGRKLLAMQVILNSNPILVMTESYTLIETISKADRSNLPYYTKITHKKDRYYYFVKLNEIEKSKIQNTIKPNE